MNTTKLHVIAKALLDELADAYVINVIQQITQALQNQINQPQQANHQQLTCRRRDSEREPDAAGVCGN